jgi:dimethylglycine catabolism A
MSIPQQGLLFQPLKLRGLTVRNRTVLTAHAKHLDHGIGPGPREIAYLERRARGGVGMIVTESSAVHPTSFPHEEMPSPFDRDSIPRFAELADAVHRHGATIFGQLYHCGASAMNGYFADRALWAPSEFRGLGSQEIAHAMTQDEIAEVVEGFAQSAVNFVEAGLDGVEVQACHGYLIQQFLSPVTNVRMDGYGGSPEGRARFLYEVVDAVRERLGEGVPVGIRVSAEERIPGGLGVADWMPVLHRLVDSGRIDYISVSNGTHESLDGVISNFTFDFGEMARYSAAFKAEFDVPIVAVGRLHTPEIAEAFLADGKADMIGMTRALIAEPDLPILIQSGRADEARPCVAVNHCFKRAQQGAKLRCAVNPDTGNEATPEPPAVGGRRRVAVVGSGPAGLEAAATAGERGHDVVLFEASPVLGGGLTEAAAFASKIGFGRLVSYYVRRLAAASVDVRLDTGIRSWEDLGDVDEVIIAIGARRTLSTWPDRDPRAGEPSTDPRVLHDSADHLAQLSGDGIIVVESEAADHLAITVAGELAERGVPFTAVTVNDRFGFGSDAPTLQRINGLLRTAGVPVHTASHLSFDGDGGGRIVNAHLKSEVPIPADARIVLSGPRRSDRAVDNWGIPDSIPVIVVGDALSPRGIAEAVREGRAAAVRVGANAAVAA